MTTITVFSRPDCRFCDYAKARLDLDGYPYREVSLTDAAAKAEYQERAPGCTKLPQILVGDHLVGGYDDLVAALDDHSFQQRIGGN